QGIDADRLAPNAVAAFPQLAKYWSLFWISLLALIVVFGNIICLCNLARYLRRSSWSAVAWILLLAAGCLTAWQFQRWTSHTWLMEMSPAEAESVPEI